jgi:hypothetical protein
MRNSGHEQPEFVKDIFGFDTGKNQQPKFTGEKKKELFDSKVEPGAKCQINTTKT